MNYSTCMHALLRKIREIGHVGFLESKAELSSSIRLLNTMFDSSISGRHAFTKQPFICSISQQGKIIHGKLELHASYLWE